MRIRPMAAVRTRAAVRLLVLACLALAPACGGTPTSPQPAAPSELAAEPTAPAPAPPSPTSSAPEPAPPSPSPAPEPTAPSPPPPAPEPPPPPPPPSDAGDNPAWEIEVLTLVNQRRAAGATCGGTTYG